MKRPIEARFNERTGGWDIWFRDTEEWCGQRYPTELAANLQIVHLRREMRDDGPSDLKLR